MAPPRTRRRRAACAVVACALAMGVSVAPGGAGLAASRNVSLRTEDGFTLAATWYEPSVRPAPAVILVHMLKGSRRDWEQVASRLASEGIGALAVDLRGHGESQSAPEPAAPPDFTAMVADVAAARRFLASRPDVLHSKIGIAGASLGASLAALHASGDAAVASLALLSPSLDYRGLRMEAAVRGYGSRPVLLVASKEDAYAGRSVKDLQKAGGGTRETVSLTGAGHGTHMLTRAPELSRMLVDWFLRTL